MAAGSIAEARQGVGPCASQDIKATEANALSSLSEECAARTKRVFLSMREALLAIGRWAVLASIKSNPQAP